MLSSQNLQKYKPKNIFKQVVRARCCGPGSAFGAEYMHACIWKIEVPLKKSQEIVIFTSMNIFNWYISMRPLHVNFGYICFRVMKIVSYIYINCKFNNWILNHYVHRKMNQKPNRTLSVIRFFIFIHRWRKWFIHFILYSNIFWSDFVLI